jgi:hypothetical protein
MAVDPIKGSIIDPQTMVQYSYVVNNPLRWVDLLGLTIADQGVARAQKLGLETSQKPPEVKLTGMIQRGRHLLQKMVGRNSLT